MSGPTESDAVSGTDTASRRRRPRGRRVGLSDRTRQKIIDAARRRFASDGFDKTSLRAVAREAEVDPALIAHYFDSKQALFLAAHQIPVDPLMLVGAALEAEPGRRGEVLARTFFERFLADPSGVGVSLIRSAASEPAAAGLLRDTIERALTAVAPRLTGSASDAGARVALASGMLLGIVFHHSILAVDAIVDLDADVLARRVGGAIQVVLMD